MRVSPRVIAIIPKMTRRFHVTYNIFFFDNYCLFEVSNFFFVNPRFQEIEFVNVLEKISDDY